MTESLLMWRKSSFSDGGGSCVEMAPSPDGGVLVRNSNHPDAGTLRFTPPQLAAWLAGCAAGELDDLTR